MNERISKSESDFENKYIKIAYVFDARQNPEKIEWENKKTFNPFERDFIY